MDWKRQIDFSPPVFFPAIAVIAVFLGFGVVAPERTAIVFDAIQASIVQNFGWLYIGSVAVFLAFAVYLLFSPAGRVRLGPDDSEPDYSYLSWFAMLFSAGMGIGLLFYGVAEPLMHFSTPPLTHFSTPDAQAPMDVAGNAQHAMGLTFLHWGLHVWAIYAIIALGLAFVAFNRGKTLSIGAFLHQVWPKLPRIVVDRASGALPDDGVERSTHEAEIAGEAGIAADGAHREAARDRAAEGVARLHIEVDAVRRCCEMELSVEHLQAVADGEPFGGDVDVGGDAGEGVDAERLPRPRLVRLVG